MVLPGDLAPIAARFWWGGVVLDQSPTRTSATVAHGSDGFLVHVQVHATLAVGVADMDDPVAVARNPQRRPKPAAWSQRVHHSSSPPRLVLGIQMLSHSWGCL